MSALHALGVALALFLAYAGGFALRSGAQSYLSFTGPNAKRVLDHADIPAPMRDALKSHAARELVGGAFVSLIFALAGVLLAFASLWSAGVWGRA